MKTQKWFEIGPSTRIEPKRKHCFWVFTISNRKKSGQNFGKNGPKFKSQWKHWISRKKGPEKGRIYIICRSITKNLFWKIHFAETRAVFRRMTAFSQKTVRNSDLNGSTRFLTELGPEKGRIYMIFSVWYCEDQKTVLPFKSNFRTWSDFEPLFSFHRFWSEIQGFGSI